MSTPTCTTIPAPSARAPLALALALAAPAMSRLLALTTGLRETGTAISLPHGFVTALTGGTP